MRSHIAIQLFAVISTIVLALGSWSASSKNGNGGWDVGAEQTLPSGPMSEAEDDEMSDEDQLVVEGRLIDDPVICERSRPPTASRISRSQKVCKTRSEWEAYRRINDQMNSDRMRNISNNARRETASTFNSANNPNAPGQ